MHNLIFLCLDATDDNNLFQNTLSSKGVSQHQQVGTTSIARRERRSHELQKSRLMKNLYH